ncbi:uncharacterized protein [Littorina saxatilis]|uniref:Uncharacterized protein n=1 Tax=Littorina saxatilis TaxID=31220 RepID=A0AAN9BIG6_9CAEN
MDGPQGTDFLGEPLFDSNKLQLEWSKAKKHVCCILDPPGVTLYMQTGTINKGDQVLPVYRCARGSTSLESFHLHQNRFIPGTSTNDDHFQAFLLEGIMRWNEDRAAAAKSGGRKPGCYNLKLNHLVNGLYQKVWGKPLDPHYKDPKQYTGELLGLDYLHGQSGKVINLEDDDTEVGFVTEVEDLFQSILEDPTLLEDVPLCEEATLAVPPSVPLEVVTPPRTQVEEDCLARSTTPPFVPCVPEELHTPSAPTPPAPTPAPIPTPTPPAPTPAAMIAADDDKESIGPDGSGGFRSVVALAKHLVSLRDVMTLSNVQCTAILDLFHKLSPGDRQSCRSVFKPAVSKSPGGRYHCSKKGRLMSQGTTSASDKVHSSRNAGAAAHPSANRLMEAVFNELALIHPRPLVEGGHRQSRVHLMQGSYDRIRQLIISNPAFQAIPLQLPAVNNETVSKWFNEKCKMEEQKVLLQGLEEQLPHPRFTSSIPLPSSAPQASTLHQPCQQRPDFILQLPANRVGLSVKKRGRVAAAPSVQSTQERVLLPALGQSVATKILPACSATSQQQRVLPPAPVPSVGAKIMPACSATSQQHSVFLPAPGQSVATKILPARSAGSSSA